MNKCPNCDNEFEGKFCPECGEPWQEEKSCPQCGAKLNGAAKFCSKCGYAFVKTKAVKSKSGFKSKLKSIWAWIKSHKKIVIPVTAVVVLAIVLGCTIPAVIAAKPNGTYYRVGSDGKIDKKNYIIIKSGDWQDSDGGNGTYKIDGNKITFYAEFFGVTDQQRGTLDNYVLKVNGATFISEKHEHSYGKWETVVEPTCVSDGQRSHKCACGAVATQKVSASDKYHKAPATSYTVGKHGHSAICTVCNEQFWQDHYDNCICGYPYIISWYGASCSIDGHYNRDIKQISIPSECNNYPVTVIGYSAFLRYYSLTSVTIPNSVTSIGNNAFEDCSSLTSVTIPNSVTSIGNNAFEDCISLKSIVIPNSVTSIGECAFDGCSSLTSVTIDGSIISIRSKTFKGCSSLKSIEIPNSVTSIGELAFRYCGSLSSIKFNGTKAQWKAISKGDLWNDNTGDYTVTCTDGTLSKSESE